MASTTLSQNDLKVLDQARQRLSQLTRTLQSLLGQISMNDPLPAWSELTQLSSVISQNLTALSTLLSENQTLLSSLAIYPVPSFPGRTQEALLEQLLRKKLEPDIEDWVEQGRSVAEETGSDIEAQRDFWLWAPQAANEQARRHMFIGNDYTREEVEKGVEKVVTGLRRKLVVPDPDSSGDEDDDDDDDDDDIAIEDDDDDDGIGMVGVRRGSEAQGGVEFDLLTKTAEPAPNALPVAAQLRFLTMGGARR